MPIYEYVCQSCKKEFETIRPMSQKDAAITCEKCCSEDVKRKLALFYAHSGGSAVPGTSSGGSGCKQIVTYRLEISGAQWNLDGAILTAKARAAWLSGTWQKLVTARSLLPLPPDNLCVHTCPIEMAKLSGNQVK